MVRVGDRVRIKKGFWREGETGIVSRIYSDGTVRVRFKGLVEIVYSVLAVDIIDSKSVERPIEAKIWWLNESRRQGKD